MTPAPDDGGPADDGGAGERPGGGRDGPDDEQWGEESRDWRYSVDDVSGDDQERDDGRDGSVLGPRPDEGGRIVPGDPDLENALFVALGVAMSLVLVLDLVGAL